MGIKGLLGSLKPYVERVHVSNYANQRVSFLRLKFADILSFLRLTFANLQNTIWDAASSEANTT
jgi:hypothetical protein